MAAIRLDLSAKEELKEFGALDVGDCFNCGSCTGICPLSKEGNSFPRRLFRYSQLGMIDFENTDIWTCATCKSCIQQCPRGVETIDYVKSLRKIIVQTGAGYLPKSLRQALVNLASVGNPFGEAPEKRGIWTADLELKPFTQDMELLLFMGCFAGYDPLVKKAAFALINILKGADVNFGILGSQESCCGESANKAGNEDLFHKLAEKNIHAFNASGVRQIVTISPHCYHTFKNEYPKLGGDFEVLHYTQYLAQLIEDGRLRFNKELDKRITYHDPCYLGRHNGIYNEPREVLSAIPGLEVVEMPLSQEISFCCGGGGGKIWLETKKEDRISDLRLQQAITIGASILAVACPYCMVNLEDSKLVNNESIVIKDIAELVWEAI
ncbi:heterodisulfide reductase-related iron-sulfur binding cluster [Chloroflexota bacterium]